jgi:hypothetical protein
LVGRTNGNVPLSTGGTNEDVWSVATTSSNQSRAVSAEFKRFLSLSLSRSGDVGDRKWEAPSFALFHKAKGGGQVYNGRQFHPNNLSQDFLDVIKWTLRLAPPPPSLLLYPTSPLFRGTRNLVVLYQ